MVPVRLTLEGIYSYREAQTIEFNRLTEAKLFGIFGPVGSGKSTILEAMIYVIYGVIDRLNNEVKYNLMNLQSDRLFVDFEFKAGEQGRDFRATVESKRNKKRFTDISVPKFLYHAWKDGEWMPCTREDVIAAIGLNAQNFKRVVIIPQGKFQDFLMLRDKERTEMMMELFGELRRYDLGGKVAYLEGETNKKMIDLKGQLTGLGEVSEDALAESKKRLVGLREDAERLKKALQEGTERENQLKKVKQLVEERGVREEEEKGLLGQKESIAELLKQVEKYEYCLQYFQQPINRWEDSFRRLAESEKALSGYRERLVGKQQELTCFKEQYNELKLRYEERDQLKVRVERLEGVIRLRSLTVEQKDLRERHAKGEAMVATTREEVEVLKRQLAERKDRLEKLVQSIPDMKLLSDIREWYSQYHHSREEETRVREELKQVENELLKDKEVVLSHKQKYSFFADAESDTSEELLEVSEKRSQQIERELKGCRDELMHLNTRQRLVDFAKELSEGEPCPLCGALSHPAPLHAEEMEGVMRLTAERIKALEREREELNRRSSVLAIAGERKRLNLNRQVQAKIKQEEIQHKLQEHLSRFVWEGFAPDDVRHLKEEIDRAASLGNERKQLEAEVKQTESEIELKRGHLEKYSKRLEEIDREVVQRETQMELLREQLNGFDVTVYMETGLESLKGEKEKCLTVFEKLGKDYREATERLQLMENEYRKWEGGAEEKEKEIVLLREEKKSGEEKLSALLRESVYEDIAAVRGTLDKKLDLPASRSRINQFNQQLHVVRVRKLELEKLLAGVEYRAEEHEALVRQLEEYRLREREVLAEHGALANQVKDMENRAAARVKIGKELDVLDARLRNLQVLKSLFRGNDFVKFVSSIYLQNLCNAANERFYRMTRQRLKLELDEDNDFVIRDYMNEGRTRSARTLSGGQIFQASLSLALALTDNIRHLTGSDQNFFFLDEGFGSLDKESLRVVFETLKSLREENRVVGLISHVEEMQQELPVCVFVENTTERGSVVTIDN
ncbi:SMC family ATPase [uncultured Butyricimonas sp.]|uniref:SbcC/MukB-like Walker B domain-containing protein n=1 Tax=uncultured Butyricimonas sp. TaxID=1268785 RepID=UPI0026DAC909|nr:SMC family ATPase [uncultured Butyricimonas sp.]